MNRCVGTDCNAQVRNDRSNLCEECFEKALKVAIEEK